MYCNDFSFTNKLFHLPCFAFRRRCRDSMFRAWQEDVFSTHIEHFFTF